MNRTIDLIKQAHEGDKKAREQVMKENIGLVWCVVKRYTGRGSEIDDLFQIGSIGLLKAIDKFNFDFDVKFSTYAVPMIAGEIKRFLRDDGMIKVSRSLKELNFKAYAIREREIKQNGREPTIDELAEEIGVEKELLVEALEATHEVESLYRPIYQNGGEEILLLDRVEKGEVEEDRIVDELLLQQLLENLEYGDRQLIYLRYFANLTQTEVGRILKISQVQVSRMEKKILGKMRKEF